MSRIKIVFVLGVWLAVLPYLGFPYAFKNILISISGLGVIYVAYLFYSENRDTVKKESFENFSENR